MNRKRIAQRRAEIDWLDAQLLCLLNQRAELARELGLLKRRAGLPLADRMRESLILARVLEKNPGPLDDQSVMRIFRRIIRESRRVQRALAQHPEIPTQARNQGA